MKYALRWSALIGTLVLLLAPVSAWGGNATFTEWGMNLWTCPVGVTEINVLCIGGGGGGAGGKIGGSGSGSGNGGGGGGGGYYYRTVSVVPGWNYWLTVGHYGIGGTGGNDDGSGGKGRDGTKSWFDASGLYANGGKGGSVHWRAWCRWYCSGRRPWRCDNR